MKLNMKCRLKQRLKKRQKTQGWLAQKTKLNRIYIIDLSNQKIENPGIKNCLKICKALGCSVEDIWSL